MIFIAVWGVGATIEHYKWSCEDKQVLRYLNALLGPDGPSGADPYPDLTVAEEAKRLYGATIGKVPKMEFEPNKIY